MLQKRWWAVVATAAIALTVAVLPPYLTSAQQTPAAVAECPAPEATGFVEVCVDRGGGATYTVGMPITICATVTVFRPAVIPPPPPLALVVTNSVDGGPERIILQEQITESMQRCLTAVVSAPVGQETVRATLRDDDGAVLGADSVTYRSVPAAQPPPAPMTPAAPGDLRPTVLDSARIRLEWTDASANETAFRVYEDTTLVAVVPAGTTAYSVVGLAPGSYHCYRVTATNPAGESAATNTACATTIAAPSLPGAPADLRATVLDSTRVRLDWTDISANESGFGVYDGTTLMLTVPVNTTTFTVSGLVPNSQHCFRVTAYNVAGESGATSTDCVTTPPSAGPPPPAPTPPPAESRRFFVSATLNLAELRPCIPAGGQLTCDATRRSLWNGEAGAWTARGVTDPDARFNETVVFRVQAGDPVAISNIARILGWPFLQITGLHFGEGQEYVEITNLGGGAQALDGWTLRSPDRGARATFGPGMTLAPGASCRVYSGGGGADVCGTTLFDARDVWPDDGGMVVLMADPIGLLADESRYSADVDGQPPPPNLEGATIVVTGQAAQ